MKLKNEIVKSLIAEIQWYFVESPTAHFGDWLVSPNKNEEWSVEYLKHNIVRAVLTDRKGQELQIRKFKVRVILEEV